MPWKRRYIEGAIWASEGQMLIITLDSIFYGSYNEIPGTISILENLTYKRHLQSVLV